MTVIRPQSDGFSPLFLPLAPTCARRSYACARPRAQRLTFDWPRGSGASLQEPRAEKAQLTPTTNEPLQSTTLIPQHTVKKLVCAFMDTRRRSSVDDDDDVPPPRPAREEPAERPTPSYADMLRSDEWPSLGS